MYDCIGGGERCIPRMMMRTRQTNCNNRAHVILMAIGNGIHWS